MTWMTIDTAPLDGTRILLREGKWAWIGSYYCDETYSFGKLSRTSKGWTSGASLSLFGEAPAPTMWMAIPLVEESPCA